MPISFTGGCACGAIRYKMQRGESCRTGVCHSCESGLVSGAVVYGPEPLDKPADGK